MTNLAWHFTGDTLRDGSPIPEVGQRLIFKGGIKICSRGYHWSKQPFDALKYAPGSKLHLVEYGGTLVEQEDKGCSSERTILKSLDATTLLRRFAADQSLLVAHLWDMPDVVREYLTTLDEKLRSAAYDAARSAADAAARSAAYASDAAAYASDAAYAAYASDAAYASTSTAYADVAYAADYAARWAAAASAAAAYAAKAAYNATDATDAAYDAARKDFNTRVYKAFNMEITQ